MGVTQIQRPIVESEMMAISAPSVPAVRLQGTVDRATAAATAAAAAEPSDEGEEKKSASEPSFWSEEENSDESHHDAESHTKLHSANIQRTVVESLSSFPDEEDLEDDASEMSKEKNDAVGIGLSIDDIEICKRLDVEYERALEEREVGYNARYHSVRQTACLSMTFMLFYLCSGVVFYTQYLGWTFENALFFLVYTITTVGFGSGNFPSNQTFQLFTICYIFVGIATLTIMVAQVYQCIALETTRAQHARDKAELARRGKNLLRQSSTFEGMTSMQLGTERNTLQLINEFDESQHASNPSECCLDWFNIFFEKGKWFFRESEFGRAVSFIFPLAGLVGLGACVVGPLEGWTVVESLYFSCVSLTTVGYGEYVPVNKASIWFCIFWLPFSVGFMSIYLGNIAAFYIRLSDHNINRLERSMRRRIKRAKESAEKEKQSHLDNASRVQTIDMGSDDAPNIAQKKSSQMGFESIKFSDDPLLFENNQADSDEFHSDRRRQRILERTTQAHGKKMQTMRDILSAVKASNPINLDDDENSTEFQISNLRSTEVMDQSNLRRRKAGMMKPSFALRAIVQERFAEIIATDIAGSKSTIEIKGNTMSVTIEALKEAAEKWLVPRRARKAFRAVAFEALLFVGEYGLVTRGADALFDLSAFEFHGIFGPLVAAMGDADTMEGWMNGTDVLADVDLRRDGTRPGMADNTGNTVEGEHLSSFQVGLTQISPESFAIT